MGKIQVVKKWNYLKPGDIVDIVAPGFSPSPEGFQKGVLFLKSWGLVPRYPKNILGRHFLHSNSDELRFDFFKQAAQAKDSAAIWCMRGGYGSNRLLPMLGKIKKPQNNKVLIGISDNTSLHVFCNQNWGWSTLHAPHLDRLGLGLVPLSLQKELKNILFGKQVFVEFSKLKPINSLASRLKKVKGRMQGGNLITLQSGIGTSFEPIFDNSIVFFEDLGERGYRIDRVLEHFKQAGLFQKCRGVVFGEFLGGEEPLTGKNNFKQVFERFAQEMPFPVFTGLEAGHGAIQRPVPLNVPAVLINHKNKYLLSIESGGK